MQTLLIAAIVWLLFLASNVVTGVALYKLGLHGQIRMWQKKLNEVEAPSQMETFDHNRYIPGSEYNPFETAHPPRYDRYNYHVENSSYTGDPVMPGVPYARGGEEE